MQKNLKSKILNLKSIKIALILGTRPEIIKMAPIVRACQKRHLDFFILHTGQHYSRELNTQIFKDLELPRPKYNLGVGGQPYRMQVGLMVRDIMEILKIEKPHVSIVQGDTISVLSGALASNRLGIKVAHHEAGLRSHDITMPEEINRVIVDQISDFLFAPSKEAVQNLKEESRNSHKVYLTGNTIVDAVLENAQIVDKKVNILNKLKLKTKKYIVVTAHRSENVDDPKRLQNIITGLELVGKNIKLPLIYPMHPRTKKNLQTFGIKIPKEVKVIDPLSFLEFLQLEKNAALVITDSGGLQEECFILKVPCITLRDNTERPETVKFGGNIVAGNKPEKILSAAKKMLNKKITSKAEPFGDGKAGGKIVDILVRELNKFTI